MTQLCPTVVTRSRGQVTSSTESGRNLSFPEYSLRSWSCLGFPDPCPSTLKYTRSVPSRHVKTLYPSLSRRYHGHQLLQHPCWKGPPVFRTLSKTFRGDHDTRKPFRCDAQSMHFRALETFSIVTRILWVLVVDGPQRSRFTKVHTGFLDRHLVG